MNALRGLVMLVFFFHGFSAFGYEVQRVTGQVTLKDKSGETALAPGNAVVNGAHLKGGDGSTLVLKSDDETISLKGPFDLHFKPSTLSSKDGNGLSLIDMSIGSLRRAIRRRTSSSDTMIIKTPNAAMGVRGTDFFVSYNKLLGETETICFESKVTLKGKKNKVEIKDGHWGGVGGRFGEKIGKPFLLKSHVLNEFKNSLPL